MSADQEVDDSFISIRIENVGGKRCVCLTSHEQDGMSRESNLGIRRLLCYPVYYMPIILFCGLLAFEILLLLSI